MGAGVGAEAVTDDPFLRRRSLRSTNSVKPIHAKAPAKTSITAGIVSMIQFRCAHDKCVLPGYSASHRTNRTTGASSK
ncbi:hypothetical protein ABIB45_004123 [Arthrobacter sp. UYCo732]